MQIEVPREAADVLAVRLRLELPGVPGQLMVRQVEDSLPKFGSSPRLGDQCHPCEVGQGVWQERVALQWPLQDSITVRFIMFLFGSLSLRSAR